MVNLNHHKLTLKQKEILRKIKTFRGEEGYFPSIRELSQILRVTSSNTVFSHLQALIKKGFLKKNSKGKMIAITDEAHDFSEDTPVQAKLSSISIPYFPTGVPAGFQAPAEDAGRESLTVDQYLIKNPNNTFALKVSGDSMENAGILPEDLLLVEKRSDARPGQIIVAHLPSGFTVKRLVEEDGEKFLKAESKHEYQIKMEEGTEVWGVVIGIIRKY
jgi:SOS regulatory protein LexA